MVQIDEKLHPENYEHWDTAQNSSQQQSAASHLVVFDTTKMCSECVRTSTDNVTELAVKMFATASHCRCRSTVCCSILGHQLFLLVVLPLNMLHVRLPNITPQLPTEVTHLPALLLKVKNPNLCRLCRQPFPNVQLCIVHTLTTDTVNYFIICHINVFLLNY